MAQKDRCKANVLASPCREQLCVILFLLLSLYPLSTNHSTHTAWIEDRRRVNGVSLTRIRRNGKRGCSDLFGRWTGVARCCWLREPLLPEQTRKKAHNEFVALKTFETRRKKETLRICGVGFPGPEEKKREYRTSTNPFGNVAHAFRLLLYGRPLRRRKLTTTDARIHRDELRFLLNESLGQQYPRTASCRCTGHR